MKASHGSSIWVTVLGCLVSLALTLTVVLPASAQESTEQVYMRQCASCHAADGGGKTPAGKRTGARDFSLDKVQNQTDAQLIEITAKGKKEMPGYAKSLTDKQIKDLVAYIRTMGKKK